METLARSANRGSVSTGFDIANSLKLEADNAELMERSSSSIGTPTSDNKATISMWVKRTELRPSGNHICFMGYISNYILLGFNNDRLTAYFTHGAGTHLISTAVFRDTSAWYHIVWAFDTTQATASNRAKMYVNGVQITAFDTETYPTQNSGVGLWETSMGHYIGWSDAQSQSGYYSEIYLIDGQQLAPTDFGEFDEDTGIWKPKAYTGTFGNEGYYLNFGNASSLGADSSGNGNNFGSLYNITSEDQALDTPTNNFCIQSNVATFRQKTPQTRIAANGGSTSEDANVSQAWVGTICTVPLFKGKWYWEVEGQVRTNSMSGIHSFVGDTGTTTSPHVVDNCYFVIHDNGSSVSALGKSINGTVTYPVTTGNVFGNVAIVGIALDLDNSLMTYYVNGGSAGTNLTNIDISDITDLGDPIMPFVSIYRYRIRTNFGGYVETSWGTGKTDANGYGNFKYTPPSGYYAICSKNLAEFG